MNTATHTGNDSVQIRSMLDDWTQAVLAKDVARIVSHYAPDIVAFDAIGPLRFEGRDAYTAHWQACMQQCSGMGLFDIREPAITISSDLALGYYLCHCGGTDDKGQEQSSWMRVTQGYRKHNGQWLIIHEHFSAPFDMESGKALFDLQP
ncbi:MAG: YybH family protein [Pseudomonas sp.]